MSEKTLLDETIETLPRPAPHRVSDRAAAQTFGTGLGAVAVLPAGVQRGQSEASDLRRPGGLQRFPFIDKTL